MFRTFGGKCALVLLVSLFVAARAFAMTDVVLSKAGTLSSALTQEQQDTCTSLVVRGKLNSADIRVLRRMAGYADGARAGRLAVLDLQQATFVRDDSPFMVLDAAECKLAGTAVPDRFKQTGQTSSEMWGGEKSSLKVVKYKPQYSLGGISAVGKTDTAETDGGAGEQPQRNTLFAPEGDFRFADGITDSQWRDMEEKYGITSFSGHRLERDGNRYSLSVSSVKNTFLSDMFYGCHALKLLVLSHKMKMDFSVTDDTAQYNILRQK